MDLSIKPEVFPLNQSNLSEYSPPCFIEHHSIQALAWVCNVTIQCALVVRGISEAVASPACWANQHLRLPDASLNILLIISSYYRVCNVKSRQQVCADLVSPNLLEDYRYFALMTFLIPIVSRSTPPHVIVCSVIHSLGEITQRLFLQPAFVTFPSESMNSKS